MLFCTLKKVGTFYLKHQLKIKVARAVMEEQQCKTSIRMHWANSKALLDFLPTLRGLASFTFRGM